MHICTLSSRLVLVVSMASRSGQASYLSADATSCLIVCLDGLVGCGVEPGWERGAYLPPFLPPWGRPSSASWYDWTWASTSAAAFLAASPIFLAMRSAVSSALFSDAPAPNDFSYSAPSAAVAKAASLASWVSALLILVGACFVPSSASSAHHLAPRPAGCWHRPQRRVRRDSDGPVTSPPRPGGSGASGTTHLGLEDLRRGREGTDGARGGGDGAAEGEHGQL